MNLLAKMAWFNVWRNRRRTLLLLCAMTAGLAGVLFCLAMINGWRSYPNELAEDVKRLGPDFIVVRPDQMAGLMLKAMRKRT